MSHTDETRQAAAAVYAACQLLLGLLNSCGLNRNPSSDPWRCLVPTLQSPEPCPPTSSLFSCPAVLPLCLTSSTPDLAGETPHHCSDAQRLLCHMAPASLWCTTSHCTTSFSFLVVSSGNRNQICLPWWVGNTGEAIKEKPYPRFCWRPVGSTVLCAASAALDQGLTMADFGGGKP